MSCGRTDYVVWFVVLLWLTCVIVSVSSRAAADRNVFFAHSVFDELARYEDITLAASSSVVGNSNDVHRRRGRSIEGAPCTTNGTANFTGTSKKIPSTCAAYPYTYCSASGHCVCNTKLAVRLDLLPGYTFCVPIQYAIDTQRCLPTEPDVCALAFPGSKCAFLRHGAPGKRQQHRRESADSNQVLSRDGLSLPAVDTGGGVSSSNNNGEWRCQCEVNSDAALNNCKLFVGMSCMNKPGICTTIGQQPGQVSTVECNSTTEGDSYATCVCLLGTEQSRDRMRCAARQCPRRGTQAPSPCRGSSYECYSPGQPQYLSGTGRFYCACRDVGVNHSEFVDGLCCDLGSMPCADFSTCINQTSLCDGVKDCADCSDEELRICARSLPNDAACVRPLTPRSTAYMGAAASDGNNLPSYALPGNLLPFMPIAEHDVVPAARINAGNKKLLEKGYDRLDIGVGNNILSPKLDAPAVEFAVVDASQQQLNKKI